MPMAIALVAAAITLAPMAILAVWLFFALKELDSRAKAFASRADAFASRADAFASRANAMALRARELALDLSEADSSRSN